MSKHTPGPWLVTREWSDDPVEYQVEVFSVGPADGSLEISISGSYLGRDEADARLIAQAPTLLADLTDAAAQLRKYETLHRAKGHLEKAEVNAALAARFEATIAAAVGGPE